MNRCDCGERHEGRSCPQCGQRRDARAVHFPRSEAERTGRAA